jgi:hypothetical protein
MPVPSGTRQTYGAANNFREDLSDIVDRISPTETPFMSAIGRGKASMTYHEWPVVELAAAVDTNAVIEGDDPGNDTANTGLRFGNYTQLSDKVVQISTTAEAADSVGNLQTLSEQVALKMLELKRDMETQMLSNVVAAAGDAGTARTSASLSSWLRTNVSRGASGTNPTLSGTSQGFPNAAAGNGTQRAFTEALLKDVVQACWAEGATPAMVLVGAFNKRVASSFAGNATRMKDAEDKKLVAAIDVYVSDFGELQIVPDRFTRARDAYVVDPSKAAVDYLQTMKQTPLAKTGHSERRMISCEYTLKIHNPKAHGVVADLTTS